MKLGTALLMLVACCSTCYGKKQPQTSETKVQDDIIKDCIAVRHIAMVQDRKLTRSVKFVLVNSCAHITGVRISFSVYDKDGVLIDGGGSTTIRSAPGEKQFEFLFLANWKWIVTTHVDDVRLSEE